MHHIDIVPANLINLANDNLANLLRVLCNDVVLLDLPNSLTEGLRGHVNKAAAKVVGEILKVELGQYLVADIVLLALVVSLLQGDLEIRILDFLDNLPDQVDLDVSLLHIHDDLEVGLLSILLADHLGQSVFDDSLQEVAVDVLQARHFGEGLDDHRLVGGRLCVLSLCHDNL